MSLVKSEARARCAVVLVHRSIHARASFHEGTALMLWRHTDDTERAVEFWRGYGY